MRKLRVALLSLVLCLMSYVSSFAGEDSTQVKWLSWEEAMELYQQEKKKIIVDVLTEWCGWCKRMDEITFKQTDIAVYINENFYPVRFDAESEEDIIFREKIYKAAKVGKREYHEFAEELLKGRFSFPTLIFMDEDLELIQSLIGFKSPHQFELIITYFASNNYKTTPWSLYQKSFKSYYYGLKSFFN